jgi:hypothetical protein
VKFIARRIQFLNNNKIQKPTKMEWHISHDRRLAAHRDRYEPPEHPANTLLLAYEDRRYAKMAQELKDSDNELKLKILHELNEDYRLANKIVLSVMTSDIMAVLVNHLRDSNNEIREFASRALVTFLPQTILKRNRFKSARFSKPEKFS